MVKPQSLIAPTLSATRASKLILIACVTAMIFGILFSGYGRDGLGETALLAFSYAQVADRGTGAIVLLSCLEGLFDKQAGGTAILKAAFEGWRNGKRARWLPLADWEHMMELPLAEVRKKLNIRWPAYYHQCLEAMAADPNTALYDQAFLAKLKEGAYMPIAPDAAFTP